jgi:hypothetical protein
MPYIAIVFEFGRGMHQLSMIEGIGDASDGKSLPHHDEAALGILPTKRQRAAPAPVSLVQHE